MIFFPRFLTICFGPWAVPWKSCTNSLSLSLQTGTQTHTHNTLAHIHTGQIHLKRSNPLTVGFRGALCASVLQTYDSLLCQLPALCANDDIECQQFSVKMYEMQKKRPISKNKKNCWYTNICKVLSTDHISSLKRYIPEKQEG